MRCFGRCTGKFGTDNRANGTCGTIYFESVRNKLTLIRDVAEKAENAQELKNRLSVLTFVQDVIYAVTVYGENGEIISSTGSGARLKKNIYKDLSLIKALFDEGAGFSVSEPHAQTLLRVNIRG